MEAKKTKKVKEEEESIDSFVSCSFILCPFKKHEEFSMNRNGHFCATYQLDEHSAMCIILASLCVCEVEMEMENEREPNCNGRDGKR